MSKESLLDQCAEECSELAQACLKYSRKFRGENPTPLTHGECFAQLAEEMADVELSMEALIKKGIMLPENIEYHKEMKRKRWLERINKK